MKRYPSCSFSGLNQISFGQLSKKEQSILELYQKLKYSHSTQFYEVQQMGYNDLPKSFPNTIKSKFESGIFLQRFTFFQMFTMLIFEYLFTNNLDDEKNSQTQIQKQKANKILRLKSLIYSEWFMQGNYFMKGLLIKGFRQLQQAKQNQLNKPLASILLTTDIILAFTQCWKQLVDRICAENELPKIQQNQIDSSVFQIFSSYFDISFDIHWKQGAKKFWKEHFKCKDENQKTTVLSIIVNPDNQISVSQRSIPITQSQVSCSKSVKSTSTQYSWNYVILVKKIPNNQKRQNFSKKINKQQKILQTVKKQGSYRNDIKLQIQCEIPSNNYKQVTKFQNNQISRISQADYSCGQTEEIKILLEDNNNIQISEKSDRKTPRYPMNFSSHITFQIGKSKQNQNFNADLNNIWEVIDRTNILIDQMRIYSENLQQTQN